MAAHGILAIPTSTARYRRCFSRTSQTFLLHRVQNHVVVKQVFLSEVDGQDDIGLMGLVCGAAVCAHAAVQCPGDYAGASSGHRLGWQRQPLLVVHDGTWWFGCYGNVTLCTDDTFSPRRMCAFDCAVGIARTEDSGVFLIGKNRLTDKRHTGSAVRVDAETMRKNGAHRPPATQ